MQPLLYTIYISKEYNVLKPTIFQIYSTGIFFTSVRINPTWIIKKTKKPSPSLQVCKIGSIA